MPNPTSFRIRPFCFYVLEEGLEPSRLAPCDFESHVYTIPPLQQIFFVRYTTSLRFLEVRRSGGPSNRVSIPPLQQVRPNIANICLIINSRSESAVLNYIP